ncbi:MAG TPA: (2Fe-2S)-binding protein [Acidiphilium sp.]
MSSDARNIDLTVNGTPRRIAVEPRRTLADALRRDCGLTGTHTGCEHGVCGACTVIMDGAAIRSCLIFAVQAEGSEIRTVESLADGDALSPLQDAFSAHHGLQCGFCTPGFLMLATAAIEADPGIDEAGLRDALGANLCRCTGYQGIVNAVLAAAGRLNPKETHHGIVSGD